MRADYSQCGCCCSYEYLNWNVAVKDQQSNGILACNIGFIRSVVCECNISVLSQNTARVRIYCRYRYDFDKYCVYSYVSLKLS